MVWNGVRYISLTLRVSYIAHQLIDLLTLMGCTFSPIIIKEVGERVRVYMLRKFWALSSPQNLNPFSQTYRPPITSNIPLLWGYLEARNLTKITRVRGSDWSVATQNSYELRRLCWRNPYVDLITCLEGSHKVAKVGHIRRLPWVYKI